MRVSTIAAALPVLLLGQYITLSQSSEVKEEESGSSSVGDIRLTNDQLDELERNEHWKPWKILRKWKRSVDSWSSSHLWKMPIHYKFDGHHTTGQRQMIREALGHWMENTCVHFKEIPSNSTFAEHHILFTRQPLGCFSYTGVVKIIPQQVNLDDECLQVFGKPVHEIGHVIGLSHEHQRTDRDDWVEVVGENIGKFQHQFEKHWKVPRGIPYELGSVMHYNARDGSINGELTLRAKDPLYQGNMGQRTGLSFSDSLYANTMYCKGECPGRLDHPCENEGYRDPKSCIRCRCPDGFTGDFCQDIAIGSCGGVYDVTVGTNVTIESPGYDDMEKTYNHHTTCTWWFKGLSGHSIQLQFVDEFGIFCVDQSCYHWVEVRFGESLATEGPRFCCDMRPSVRLTSSNEQMLVLFRSNWDSTSYGSTAAADGQVILRGFRATVSAVLDINRMN